MLLPPKLFISAARKTTMLLPPMCSIVPLHLSVLQGKRPCSSHLCAQLFLCILPWYSYVLQRKRPCSSHRNYSSVLQGKRPCSSHLCAQLFLCISPCCKEKDHAPPTEIIHQCCKETDHAPPTKCFMHTRVSSDLCNVCMFATTCCCMFVGLRQICHKDSPVLLISARSTFYTGIHTDAHTRMHTKHIQVISLFESCDTPKLMRLGSYCAHTHTHAHTHACMHACTQNTYRSSLCLSFATRQS